MLKSVSSVINAIGALNYKGTWNATTNTPTLASGVGTKGDYYVVSVAGTTTLDGISNWGIGDWAVFNGSVWQRVEGGADLNGVNLSVTGTTTLSGLTASTALALDASKNVVSVTNTGTGNNVLATSPTMTTPRVVTSINDTNGNEVFGITATASAVNELTVANAATGNNPVLSATGSDTNIGITLTPKGTGNVTLSTGNLVQGTAAKGVNFTANTPAAGMTSQLLNWYEEGTWTPILTDLTNDATMHATSLGSYTRIGNTVFYRCRCRVDSLGSVTGAVYVKGLPFTIANNDSNSGGGNTISFGNVMNTTAGYAVSQTPVPNTNYVGLYIWDAAGGQTALVASEFSTGNIFFSGQYYV